MAPPWVDSVGQIFSVIPDLATPEQVQHGLREILDDPSLELFWWDWEAEFYVDVSARRAISRNLHDGAQQRLMVALLGLRRLERLLEGSDEPARLAGSARQELEEAIEDLRELARGLHPPLLARHGLAAAVRSASARASIPIELELYLPNALPPAVEAAAYYVCAEAVTNTIKHAQASRVRIGIVHANGTLEVDVSDDGIGGACIDLQPGLDRTRRPRRPGGGARRDDRGREPRG
jgi:signal transduction histidine kinase